jgi:hypothetical protein
MRPILLAVPGVFAVVCMAGLWVTIRAMSAAPREPLFEPKHFVTPEMVVKTDTMRHKIAKSFAIKDVEGKPVLIAQRGLTRPQFIYFVHDDCPCSYAAEPLFHSLFDRFKGQIDFISVINAGPEKGKKWVNEMDVPYAVVPDPKVDIMKAYSATSSAYSALVTPDGRIDKMWPGFSRDLLLEMNREMARVTGQPEMPFDTQYAPIQKATGCSF